MQPPKRINLWLREHIASWWISGLVGCGSKNGMSRGGSGDCHCGRLIPSTGEQSNRPVRCRWSQRYKSLRNTGSITPHTSNGIRGEAVVPQSWSFGCRGSQNTSSSRRKPPTNAQNSNGVCQSRCAPGVTAPATARCRYADPKTATSSRSKPSCHVRPRFRRTPSSTTTGSASRGRARPQGRYGQRGSWFGAAAS